MEKPYEELYDTNSNKADEPITAPQKWMLLGALLIGLTFHLVFFTDSFIPAMILVSCSWVCYAAVFMVFNLRRAKEIPYSFILLACALYLCVITPFQANGYSDDNLIALNVLAVPCLLMMHAQVVTRRLPLGRELEYALYFLYGFFVQPFRYIGRCFSCAGSLFKNKRSSAFIGVVIAIPVAAVVLALLVQADAVMGMYADQLLRSFDLGAFCLRIILIAIIMALFYSFLYGATWASEKPFEFKHPKKWQPQVTRIVVGTLLAIYAVFTAVQFVYLFGGHGLPEGLTYAEYAREGFSQLVWVAIINLSVFAVCLCLVNEDGTLRVMMLLLLLASGVILASSFTRLGLYIDAYGLTFKRIQAFWMLCYLTATFILCAVRVYKKKLPLLTVCALLFALWYVALNIPNLNAWYA